MINDNTITDRTNANLSMDQIMYICLVCRMALVVDCFMVENSIYLRISNKYPVEITNRGPRFIAREVKVVNLDNK